VTKIREVTATESEEINRLANSQKEKAIVVKRAQVIKAVMDNPKLSANKAAKKIGYSQDLSALKWIKRFNKEGVKGLTDRPRAGRPPVHREKDHSLLINLACQKPSTLGYPFALWTLKRLQGELEKKEGLHLSDSTIWGWLKKEGLIWKRQQSWFHEAQKHDPEFVEKRGL